MSDSNKDYRDYGDECKVFVGNLDKYHDKNDLERAFRYYGPIVATWVARNPPGFGFVTYEDSRDAEDAVKGMDGKTLGGSRIRVEKCRGDKMRGSGRRRQSDYDRRDNYDRERDRERSKNWDDRKPFRPDTRCCYCREKGHFASDCPNDSRGVGPRGARGDESNYRSRDRYSRDSPRRSRSRDRSPRRSRSRDRSSRRSRSRSF